MKKQVIVFIFMFSLVKIKNINSEALQTQTGVPKKTQINEVFKLVVHKEILDKIVPEFKTFRQKYGELFAALSSKISINEKEELLNKLIDFGNSVIDNQRDRLENDNLTLGEQESIKYVISFILNKLNNLENFQ